MAQIDPSLSTGIRGLDRVLRGLIPGDNVVYQVDEAGQYRDFAAPASKFALRRHLQTVYFRFGDHPPLIEDAPGLETVLLNPQAGFEPFITTIHETIKRNERGGYYIFDCLTELAAAWGSDQMLGNFFMLTCPRLYDVAAIAYFAVLRNRHSQHALSAIMDTTQIFIDLIDHDGQMYIQPIKVQQRYSTSMHTIHARNGNDFIPITQSSMIAEVRASTVWSGLDSSGEHLNTWNRAFLAATDAQQRIDRGDSSPAAGDEHRRRLIRMAISRDDKIIALAEEYFTLPDLLRIGRRIVGTGLIGGKSVGMLLAGAILTGHDERWKARLETHDSFYIGADVFYSFLVTNGIWWVRQQKNLEMLLEGAITARQRMIVGRFPEPVVSQLEDMLDYFGQSPIIVRSSSLLEDNYGNAFAGKYESVFCVNQGPRYKRLEDLMTAIRSVYASAMSENALEYRARRGMLESDEQMSLLIQRVSGELHSHLFYPHAGGVGLSFNPYVWSDKIDPAAGVLRMVFGMGTRAVDYKDNDYTRIVALNAPARTPDGGSEDAARHSQRNADVLDLEANQLVTIDWRTVAQESPGLPIDLLCSHDEQIAEINRRAGGKDVFAYRISFERLLADTNFVDDMRAALSQLAQAYDNPVDIEFTLNLRTAGDYRINIVQCRPFQCPGGGNISAVPENLDNEQVILRSEGAVIGRAREIELDRIIYVIPSAYDHLSVSDKYSVARLIGKVSKICSRADCQVLLMGPGRWGTSSPELGVPINFAEISTVAALCEIVAMREGLVPDVSLGTHLFNEMVETEMLYLALYPERKNNHINIAALEGARNLLAEITTAGTKFHKVVRVVDPADIGQGRPLLLNADDQSRRVVCYFKSIL